jgi:tetratricopeptide (TPR) repeat protein
MSFDSAVEGVRCSAALQKVFQSSNLPVRIGIHLGDVVFTDNNVFGDGVNVASRIESMGVPGCILFSKAVRNQLKNQEDLKIEPLGSFAFKNVEESVEVFCLANEGIVKPSRNQLSGKFKQPSKSKLFTRKGVVFAILALVIVAFISSQFWPKQESTSITPRLAILDFISEGEAADQSLISGMIGQINAQLTGLKNVEVISRSSIKSLDKENLTPVEKGRELKANFILEGRVEWIKKGEQEDEVKVVASLIDVEKDKIEWTEQFQEPLSKTTDLQRNLSFRLLKELNVSLSEREENQLDKPLTDNSLAYQAYINGLKIKPPGHGAEKDFRTAYKFFKQAVVLDAEFGMAWLELGNSYMDFYWYGYEPQPSTMDTAYARLLKAKELLPDDPNVEAKFGDYHYRLRHYDQAMIHFSNAQKHRPNDPRIMQYIAELWRRQGLFEEAIEYMEKGLSLDPLNHNYVTELSWTNLFVGNYNRSLELQDLATRIAPEAEWNYLIRSLILWSRGENNDLQTTRNLLANVPDPRSDYPAWFWITQFWFENDVDGVERLVNNIQGEAIELQHSWEPIQLLEGMIAKYRKKTKEAKRHFEEAVEILEKKASENPSDFRIHSSLGLTYAGLGEKEKAIRSGQKSLKLLPLENDHLMGLDVRYGMMRIYAILGEDDLAMDMMSELLSVPCQYSGFFFTKNPEFNNFRNSVRFHDLLDKQRRIYAKFYET